MSVSSSESESQAALTELEKGLRSAKVGEQAEAIVRLVMTCKMSCVYSLLIYTQVSPLVFPVPIPHPHQLGHDEACRALQAGIQLSQDLCSEGVSAKQPSS